MTTTTLPIAVPVSRPALRRALDFATDQWRAWRAAREEQRALNALADLDPSTLRDIGAPEEVRAWAAARQAAPYERLRELLG
jgi:hypothetical protein